MLDWSGDEAPEFWKPFADQFPDVKVDFSFFAEDAEALAKIQSGFQVDLVHPCNSWLQQYVDGDLLQPIDTSRLKNWPGVDPRLAKFGQFNGKQYFIPWDWGYESILVRTDKVSKIPQSWADLWDPQYAGKVSIFDSAETAWMVAATALGIDPYHVTPEQRDQIKQKLIALKPNLLNYWSDYTEIVQLVANGDVSVAGNAWNDAYVLLKDQGVPVEYTEPKEGRLGYVCGYVIPKNAKNVDLAYAYLDALLDPQSEANYANEYYYGVSNRDAIPLIDPAVLEAMHVEDAGILDRTKFYQSISSDLRQMMADVWSEVKASQ